VLPVTLPVEVRPAVTALPPVVIFDLDDTLINYTGMSEELWRVICAEQAPAFGLDGNSLHAALIVERVRFWADPELNRLGRHNLVEASRLVVAGAFRSLGAGTDAQAIELSRLYHERRHDLVHLYDDSVASIEELRARGHRLAMITNGAAETQRDKIVRFDLARHFDCILVEGEFGVGKPDERVYRHVLSELGVQPADAMMVGDDLERDVAGPQRVGMQGVWIDRLGKGSPATSTVKPDRVIVLLSDLL
jgi:putative hydrolase of the HAD superfamily